MPCCYRSKSNHYYQRACQLLRDLFHIVQVGGAHSASKTSPRLKEGCNDSFLQEDEDEDFMEESIVNKEGCNESLCRRTRTKTSWTNPL
jgi:hypothetical protein